MRRIAFAFFGFLLVGAGAFWAGIRFAGPPSSLGVQDGRLNPCPDSPNCVSSFADPSDRLHAIAPLPLPAGDPMAALREIIAAERHATLIRAEGPYLHALYRTPTVGFPDDVEFLIDEAAGVIHVRSAARLGYDDLGTNRARVEALRSQLLALR